MILRFYGSANGAGTCTSTAIDAGVSVDNVTIVALGNSANGAAGFTSAAADASVSNYICH